MTTKIQSSSIFGLPANRQWFNAVEKRNRHTHPCGPFKCTGLAIYNGRPHLVEAMDAEGDAFEFKVSDFLFFDLPLRLPTRVGAAGANQKKAK